MSFNSRPGVRGACDACRFLAHFTARHRNDILAVVLVLSPGDVAAVTAALDTIQTISTLFTKICDLWEASL